MTSPKVPTRSCSHCGGTGREMDPVAIGKQLRELRQKAGMSLRTVADRLGFTAPYISDLERGNRSFTQELAAKYREALK